MKFKDITFNPEEVIQSLNDAGIIISDEGPTIGEIVEAAFGTPTYKLLEIATELDARETTSNCVIRGLQGVGWNELCDMGIELLEKLKTK